MSPPPLDSSRGERGADSSGLAGRAFLRSAERRSATRGSGSRMSSKSPHIPAHLQAWITARKRATSRTPACKWIASSACTRGNSGRSITPSRNPESCRCGPSSSRSTGTLWQGPPGSGAFHPGARATSGAAEGCPTLDKSDEARGGEVTHAIAPQRGPALAC